MLELEKRMDELKVALDARDDLQAKQDLLGESIGCNRSLGTIEWLKRG